MTAIKKWCDRAGIASGYIFCEVDRYENIGITPLNGRSVGTILKNVAFAAGLSNAKELSSHSLRRGFATTASRKGASFVSIMRHGRWRHEGTVLGYIGEGQRFLANAAQIVFQGARKHPIARGIKVMIQKNKRLHLLSESEIKSIYCLPSFTERERHHYFQLSEEEETAFKGLHISARVYFVLQLGFFRAKHLLFTFTFFEVREDLKYVLSRHFPVLKRPSSLPSRNRLTAANKKIVAMHGFKEPTNKIQKLIEEKLAQSIQQINKPMVIFRELLSYLNNEKIIFPRYSTLQDWVGNAIITEETRIHQAIKNHVTQKTIALINQLFTTEKDQRYYDLTLLKQRPKNFNYKMIQTEIKKHKKYYPLYHSAKRFLPILQLSEKNIAYYGSLVEHYQVQSLQQFSDEKRYFYLLCYVYHRFQIMNDQLIETFFHYVDLYNKDAKSYAKTRADEVNTDVKTKHGSLAKKLLFWYFDKSLSKKVYEELQKAALSVYQKRRSSSLANFLRMMRLTKNAMSGNFMITIFNP